MVTVTKKYLAINNLQNTNPTLAREWHPIKNGQLTPVDVTKSANRKVWWKCREGHEWIASVNSRDRGCNCPYCSGRKVCTDNCLHTKNPELASEWNFKKNHPRTPFGVTHSSNQKVWWRCKVGHEWMATVSNRNQGSKCPSCRPKTSELELRVYSELKSLFHNVKNRSIIFGKELDIFIPKLKLGVEIDGAFWHQRRLEKDKEKNSHLQSNGIKIIRIREKPLAKICDSDIVFDARCAEFEIMRQLLCYVLNNFCLSADEKIIINSYLSKGIFTNGLEFTNLIKFLPGPLPGNSLQEVNPVLAQEWNVNKNFGLTPTEVYSSGGKKVWWKCEKGHEWQARLADRQKGYGCPFCSNNLVCDDNCLAKSHPLLASQWHPTKNGELNPYGIAYGSGKKVWWKCEKGHEWQAKVCSRQYHSCPYCANQRVDKNNSLMVLNPTLSGEWNSTKNGELTPAEVTAGTARKVWWTCKKGHEWLARIVDRNHGHGCPKCAHVLRKQRMD